MSTHIVLFHSALGLTKGVRAFAEHLRSDELTVVTTDLYDGESFDNLDDGMKKRNALGVPELMRRAIASVEGMHADVVYAGFSMGAAAAQAVTVAKPGARGVFLMHGAAPLQMLGVDRWPSIPTQVHVAEADPLVDQLAISQFSVSASAELFKYPGHAHLFSDDSGPEYEAASATLLLQRLRAFVKRVS